MEKYELLKTEIEKRMMDIKHLCLFPVRKEIIDKIKNVKTKEILVNLKYFSLGKFMFLKNISEEIKEGILFLSEEEWKEILLFLYDKIESLTDREIFYALFDDEKLIPPWDRIRYTVNFNDKRLLTDCELKKMCKIAKDLLTLKVKIMDKKEEKDELDIVKKLLEIELLTSKSVYSYQAYEIIKKPKSEEIKNVVKNWYHENGLTFATDLKNSEYHIPNLYSYLKKLEEYSYLIDEKNIEIVRNNLYPLLEKSFYENECDPSYLQDIMKKYY